MMSRSAEWNNANNMNKKESDTKLNIVQKHSEYNAVGQIFTTHHIIYDKISEIEKQDFLLRDKKCTLTVKALLSQGVSFSKIYDSGKLYVPKRAFLGSVSSDITPGFENCNTSILL